MRKLALKWKWSHQKCYKCVWIAIFIKIIIFRHVPRDTNKYFIILRLSSGERWKIICERYHSYDASVEEHQRKNVPWKAWLFKCLHILNLTSNSLKMRPDFYATCLCIPMYIFLCTVLVTLPRLGQISYSVWWLQNLAVHTNIYMLRDQLFLINSTPFLSQCNRLTILSLLIGLKAFQS